MKKYKVSWLAKMQQYVMADNPEDIVARFKLPHNAALTLTEIEEMKETPVVVFSPEWTDPNLSD